MLQCLLRYRKPRTEVYRLSHNRDARSCRVSGCEGPFVLMGVVIRASSKECIPRSSRHSQRESGMVFVMLPRRTVLQPPLLLAAERAGAVTRKMTISMHQFTSARAGYRKSLEGWSKAGIRDVEP